MNRVVVTGWCFLVLGSMVAPTAARAQVRSAAFANPPLKYSGPNPAATDFLPSQLRLADDELFARPPLGFLPTESADSDAYPGSTLESFLPDDFAQAISGSRITDHKSGVFQKLSFSVGRLDRNKPDGYGLTEANLFSSFAVPLPRRDWPLLITPTLNVRFLDGPSTADIPTRLYGTFVDFTWLPKLSPRWMGIVGVAPGIYSDFEQSDDAFRVTARALLRYEWTYDRLQLLFGAAYLDRDDVQLIPAGGVVWVPTPSIRYDLIFPQPTIAHRLRVAPGFEDWIYLAGEFGGNTYAIEQQGGQLDRVTLRDYRVLLGVKRKHNGGAGIRIEVGFVFGREIEFRSNTPTVEADETALVRGAVVF